MSANATDFAALLPDVARRLLGDPPRIGADEWRYGSRGSLAVHVGGAARGTWHDFEADRSGGGVLDLIEHLQQTATRPAPWRWLVDARLIDPPAGADARPANRGKPCHNAARVAAPIRPAGPDARPPDSGPYRVIADRVAAPRARNRRNRHRDARIAGNIER